MGLTSDDQVTAEGHAFFSKHHEQANGDIELAWLSCSVELNHKLLDRYWEPIESQIRRGVDAEAADMDRQLLGRRASIRDSGRTRAHRKTLDADLAAMDKLLVLKKKALTSCFGLDKYTPKDL